MDVSFLLCGVTNAIESDIENLPPENDVKEQAPNGSTQHNEILCVFVCVSKPKIFFTLLSAILWSSTNGCQNRKM